MHIQPVSNKFSLVNKDLQCLVLGSPIVVLTIMAQANINKAIPMGIIHLRISSLRPYLLDSERPIKFPTVFTDDRNIMLYNRSLLEFSAKPASFITEGP